MQLLQCSHCSFMGVKRDDAKALCSRVVGYTRSCTSWQHTLDSWVMALRKKSTSITVLCWLVKNAASSSAEMCGGTREKKSWDEGVSGNVRFEKAILLRLIITDGHMDASAIFKQQACCRHHVAAKWQRHVPQLHDSSSAGQLIKTPFVSLFLPCCYPCRRRIPCPAAAQVPLLHVAFCSGPQGRATGRP